MTIYYIVCAILILIGITLILLKATNWLSKKMPGWQKQLKVILKWLIIGLIIVGLIWLTIGIKNNWPAQTNTPSPTNTPSLCQSARIQLPFARVPDSINVINENEPLVTINGSEEEGTDTGLILQAGQSFTVEQIAICCNPKNNRITYNFYGDAAPIWGGNDYSNGWPVKYYVPNAGNSVLVILRTEDGQEKVFNFKIGRTSMANKNNFTVPAKLFLYYNCVLEFQDAKGNICRGHTECGWDGSTATFKIKIK